MLHEITSIKQCGERWLSKKFMCGVMAILDDEYGHATWSKMYLLKHHKCPEVPLEHQTYTHAMPAALAAVELVRWFVMIPRAKLSLILPLMRAENDYVIWSIFIHRVQHDPVFIEQYNALFRLWLDTRPTTADAAACLAFTASWKFINWKYLTPDNLQLAASRVRLSTVMCVADIVATLMDLRIADSEWLYVHLVDPYFVGTPPRTQKIRMEVAHMLTGGRYTCIDNALWHYHIGIGVFIEDDPTQVSVLVDEHGRVDLMSPVSPALHARGTLSIVLNVVFTSSTRTRIHRMSFEAPRTSTGVVVPYKLYLDTCETRVSLTCIDTAGRHELLCEKDTALLGRQLIWSLELPKDPVEDVIIPALRVYWGNRSV